MDVAIGVYIGVLAASEAARWKRKNGWVARACIGLMLDIVRGRPYLFMRNPRVVKITYSRFDGVCAGHLESLWLEENKLASVE